MGLPGLCATQEDGLQTAASWKRVSPTLSIDWNPGLHDSHQAEKSLPPSLASLQQQMLLKTQVGVFFLCDFFLIVVVGLLLGFFT